MYVLSGVYVHNHLLMSKNYEYNENRGDKRNITVLAMRQKLEAKGEIIDHQPHS
jgi:hypothetical protein